MAKSSCLPRSAVERMKQAIRDGEINVKELFSMSSDERRETFRNFASDELAQQINASFERAIVSKQKDALKKWAEKTFTVKDKKESNYANVLKRIDELDELGVLNDTNADNYLSDLITDVMGISISTEEIKQITEKAKKLETAFSQKTEDGIPSVEYWQARREMDDYIESLTPASNLRVLTSVVGRGAMLFSVKSPLTNIISNTVQGAVQGLERRVSSGTYKGLNGDFAVDYAKKVMDIYQKTGYDISRMESIEDSQRTLGEEITTSEGEGPIRGMGRWYEDIVFKQLMGAPDVASSAVAFADSANLASTKFAEVQGLKGEEGKATALEIFKDAVRIRPETVAGEMVRSQAIADAKYSTYTNKGGYSDFAMAIRAALNNATGDIRLGDQLMPFVKTPANVIQAGVDAAGVGAFRGFFKLPEAVKEMKAGNGEPMKEVVRHFVRSGLGMTLATVLAYMIDPEDFVGEYDILSQKERDLARLKNAPFNSVKVGDRYVSLDYFGPLASAFVGIMYARKYGEDLPSKIFQYGRGAGAQALRVPGLKEFSGLVMSINNAVKKGDLGDITQGLTDEAVGYIRARTIPAIVNDVAKGIDPLERQTDDGLTRAIASVPLARQTLEPRIDQTTGKPEESEGFLSTVFFGSRLAKADESAIVKEFEALAAAGVQPTLSDVSKSGRMKELKEQGGVNFNEALKYYGKEFGEDVAKKIKTTEYKKSTPEDKKKTIDSIRKDAVEKTLRKFGYKKKKD